MLLLDHQPEEACLLDLTVAICTAGERSTLDAAIRSLVAQDWCPPGGMEVLVVDNSRGVSTFVPRVVDEIAQESPIPVRYTREPEVGLGFARNAASAHAEGEIVAYVDDDAVIDPGWARALLATYAETDASAVGGRVDPLWDGERPSWLGDELLGYLSIVDYGPERRECHFPQYPFGVNISFRHSALESIGGFATALGGGGAPTYLMDEIDVCRRLERAGHRIYYAPDARVQHLVPPSRMTHAFFFQRAAVLGRATARMGWSSPDVPRTLPACLKGEVLAGRRALRHGLRTLLLRVTRRERDYVSERRHLIWNATWMWEIGSLALKRA